MNGVGPSQPLQRGTARFTAVVACALACISASPVAASQPDENPDGSVSLETTGPVAAQILFSKAFFRNAIQIASPTNPTIAGLRCKVGSTEIPGCFFDTQTCSGCPQGDKEEFNCRCIELKETDLGTMDAGDALATNLHSDTDRNGTVDQVWSSDEAKNSDGMLDHLRTSKIFPGTWLFEWEDAARPISDLDFNDLVYVVRQVPSGFPLNAAPTPCRSFEDRSERPDEDKCPGQDVSYLSKLTIDPPGTPDRKLILTVVALNFGSAPHELAICTMLNVPENFAALGPRDCSKPSRCTRYALTHYIFESGDGLADCDPLGGASHPHGAIRFSNLLQTGEPSCPSVPAPPAGVPDDVLMVPAAGTEGAGRAEYVRSVRIADLDARLLAEDRLGGLTSEEIRKRLAELGGHHTQLYTDIFYDIGYRPFLCPSGFNVTFGEGFSGPSVAPDVGKVVWTWNNLTTAKVASPVEVVTELSNAEVMGPGGKDTRVFLDVIWDDNLEEHLFGHIGPIILESAPGGTAQPEIRVRELFTLLGGRDNPARVRLNFPDDLPTGFMGRATLLVYRADTEEVLVSSVLHFAKDSDPPVLAGSSTLRTPNGVTLEVTARDAAPGLQEVLAFPFVAFFDRMPLLLRYVSGDFLSDTSYTGQVGTPDSSTPVSLSVSLTDELGNATTAAVPVAHAGKNRTAVADRSGKAMVTLNGLRSTNDPAHPLTFEWSGPFGTVTGVRPAVSLPIGEHTIQLLVRDDRGFEGRATVKATVVEAKCRPGPGG